MAYSTFNKREVIPLHLDHLCLINQDVMVNKIPSYHLFSIQGQDLITIPEPHLNEGVLEPESVFQPVGRHIGFSPCKQDQDIDK